MKTTMRMIGAMAGCLLAVVPLAAAQDGSPIGRWQAESGESRYNVTYCGDGKQLCARLTWLREDVKTAGNLAMLNTYIVRHARQAENGNVWRGEITFEGRTYSGTMTLLSNDHMRVNGCSGIMCKNFDLKRF